MIIKKGSHKQRLLFSISEKSVLEFSDLLNHLLSGLRFDGYECAVIAPPGLAYDFACTLPVEPVRHPYINTCLFRKFNLNKISSFMESYSPDLIHCFSDENLSLINALAEKYNRPYIMSSFSPPKGFLRAKPSQANCFKILAANQHIVDELSHRYPNLNERVIKAKLGTLVNSKIACFVTENTIPSIMVTQSTRKVNEFHTLLSAVRHLGIDGYEFMLVIIGQGKNDMALRKMVQNMGLSHLVNIVGNINPIRKFLCGADIYLQPWPVNEFNFILHEAIGTGLALAVPKDNPEMLDDRYAVLFDHRDELSLYAVVKELLDRKDLARQLADRAQKELGSTITASGMIENMKELYAECMDWYAETALHSDIHQQ